MFNVTSMRYRYTQFFVLFMLCSLIYVMVQEYWFWNNNFSR